MNHTELIMRRRNVRAFIEADYIRIVLSRNAPSVKTAAGGVLPGPASTLPPQKVRIVLNKRRFNGGLVNSEAGEIPHTDYLLIAEYNRDIQVEDSFMYMAEHYKVIARYGARTESLLFSIDLLGKENRRA